ncbi:3-dehydroquinate synthase, partial [Staphylococcus epidermidis]
KLKYPLSIIKQLHFEDTYHFMLLDKKNDYNGIQMVLLKNLGKPVVTHVDKDTLLSAFEELQSYFK